MTWSDFQRLQDLPAEILRQKAKLQRLEDAVVVKSPRWGAMPHGSGTHDKIGDLVPEIVDAEDELANLEKEQETIRWRFGSWIDQQSDIKAQVILSMRYIERMSWEQIADECTGCGDPTTDSAARKYATRYLKQHLAKMKNNGQESR